MKTRTESDLLGELEVPSDAYYGVQTQRAIENFKISNSKLSDKREFISALGAVKIAAVQANFELNLIEDEKLVSAIVEAATEVMGGKFDEHFPVDMIQGGAGTSVNMNANEVIANRALEILGYEKGDYSIVSPNDHVNLSQSTNDAYPTALRLTIISVNKKLVAELENLIEAFRKKGSEFSDVVKMGRTQLQDAVPMTLEQEFEAYAVTLSEEVLLLNRMSDLLLEINMGATAIGTGINSVPGYASLCTQKLAEVTGEKFVLASNLVEATPDTGAFVVYSSALKRFSLKLSKICNDLRLLASGPRAGLGEINLPEMQPGSSIMPGKVNPVIPEVVNQVCFKVIGNDLTVAFASEAGQLELNVMEPIMIHSILESIELLINAMVALREKCVDGITANKEVCYEMVKNSIGIVTALNPYIGYKTSTKVAKEALETGESVYDIVLRKELLSKEKLDEILDPRHMISSHEF